eukprot:1137298-Pelagomonas_calceolata.AAC.3
MTPPLIPHGLLAHSEHAMRRPCTPAEKLVRGGMCACCRAQARAWSAAQHEAGHACMLGAP